ncbi:MAG: TIGR00341 family protein [Halanaerobiales bacterium]
MQVVHATLKSGEGKEAVDLLDTLGIDIEDYKLIESDTGDLLIINLLYGDTDVLLDNLTTAFDFEEDEDRSLVIFTPDTVIPRDKKKEEKETFHSTRESLITYANNNSQVNIEFIILIIVSSIIATLGLILDNVAIIVGSMVIAPMLGPILGITVGIVLGDSQLIKQAISTEIIGTVVAILVGSIIGIIIPDIEITNSIEIRTLPTMADLLIALSAGAASAYSLMKGKLTSLVGVMVAASLIPVTGTIGIGISMRSSNIIIGGLLLLGGNFLGLILSNIIVLYLEGLRPQIWYKYKAQKIVKKSLIFILVAVVLLSIPLGIFTVYQFYIEKPAETIKNIIRDNLVNEWDYKIENIEIKGNLIYVYMYAEREVEEETKLKIKNEISRTLDEDYNINFKVIPIQESTI